MQVKLKQGHRETRSPPSSAGEWTIPSTIVKRRKGQEVTVDSLLYKRPPELEVGRWQAIIQSNPADIASKQLHTWCFLYCEYLLYSALGCQCLHVWTPLHKPNTHLNCVTSTVSPYRPVSHSGMQSVTKASVAHYNAKSPKDNPNYQECVHPSSETILVGHLGGLSKNESSGLHRVW